MVLIAFPVCAQQNAFDKLKSNFEQGKIFSADFSHEYVDSYTGDSVASSGQIWVGENKYKVEAQNQLVVVDGQTSKVYDDSRNRVIISTYEPAEDDFAPSRILNGADSTYTIENQQRKNGEVIITLVSEDPFSVFQEVVITLDKQLIPLRIFALDQADNEITTTFRNGSFIDPRPGMFELAYPQDAEIVDMRNN
ncbi:MAG: outer membrane lipoprotein carrier protein LolA [Balneolaceae bacterium]|nr:outer membrane lipoprotein carrier protein LolA [Balneolaceae bacterium]